MGKRFRKKVEEREVSENRPAKRAVEPVAERPLSPCDIFYSTLKRYAEAVSEGDYTAINRVFTAELAGMARRRIAEYRELGLSLVICQEGIGREEPQEEILEHTGERLVVRYPFMDRSWFASRAGDPVGENGGEPVDLVITLEEYMGEWEITEIERFKYRPLAIS